MYLIYSILLTAGFILMIPFFLLRREKYAAGFRQRLGEYPEFVPDGRKVIWLHCVSVGETNAARPLVDSLLENFPDHRLVFSTTTKTGQQLAQKIFADKADAVIYFPFDFKFSVRRALEHFKPSLVLLMETEIWPRFIREAKLAGAKVAIVNGRLSERSFGRYSKVRSFISRVLVDVDLALMQGEADAERLTTLGMSAEKTKVAGNLKFDQPLSEIDAELTDHFRSRFGITSDKPLIVAASTHEPEEQYVLESLDGEIGHTCRLLLAPRHPERFDEVENLLRNTNYSFVRRRSEPSGTDSAADIILLDSIGELRAVYPLSEIVFVGGSLIPHGGQSVIEPAMAGKAIITGPYTANFDSVVKDLIASRAIIQTPTVPQEFQNSERLFEEFDLLLREPERRKTLGENAKAVMDASRGATVKTIEFLNEFYKIADS